MFVLQQWSVLFSPRVTVIKVKTIGFILLCSIHVVSVVQMTHMLLCHGGIMRSKAFGTLQHLAAYWSAAVHDFEHGGLNNDFLTKTAHPLAITYNDLSPLENHHMSAAVRLLCTPECQYIPVSTLPCCRSLPLHHFFPAPTIALFSPPSWHHDACIISPWLPTS